jgi:hypothetical protein
MQRGPSFMFIGAAKAGSTWFFEILREHHGVFVPPNRGTYFFCNSFDLGFPWYAKFFPKRPRGRVIGEVCHDYLLSSEALQRIRNYRPEMRLICCLRNPYERAISAWRFYGRNGLDLPTLAEQGRLHADIFDQGNYATQLAVAKSLFPDNQILVFLFEDLMSAPQDVARRLYEFIGVDPDFVPPSLYRRVNSAGRARSRLLARLVHDLHMRSWGRSRLFSKGVGWLKRAQPLRRVVTTLLYDERPQTTDWREQFSQFPDHIVAQYEEEIGALERMLGRDLSSWRGSEALAYGGERRLQAKEASPPTVAQGSYGLTAPLIER